MTPCRFEFPLELNMYKYTKAAADAREAAEAAQNEDAPAAADDGVSMAAAAAAAEAAGTADCWYELRGILVHSGTANAGHYYSYIKVGLRHTALTMRPMQFEAEQAVQCNYLLK